jgi:hypothetical protein
MRTPAVPAIMIGIAIFANVPSTVLVLACNQATIDKLDPPVQYAPDPRCDQLDDEKCGHECCNESRNTTCNAFRGKCEGYVDIPPCTAPLGCGQVPGYMGQKHHERDAATD